MKLTRLGAPYSTAMALFVGASLLAAGCDDDDGAAEPEADAGMDAQVVTPDSGGGDSGGDDASAAADSGAPEKMYVTLSFKAKVGDEDFACDRTYPSLGTTGVEVAPRDLRVFVQDVKLLRASDQAEVPLQLDEREGVQRTDVTLLDFETNADHCVGAGGTSTTNMTVTGWVPKDSYRGLVFSNGVPVAVNHENPIDLTAPLTEGPLHWGWTGGFLFIVAELREVVAENDAGSIGDDAGAPGDGGAAEDAGAVPERAPGSVVLHIGSSACGGTGCARSNRNHIAFPEFDPASNVVVLDVAKLVEHLDLREISTCHGVGASCPGFFPAVGLDFETGEPSATQAMYRVE